MITILAILLSTVTLDTTGHFTPPEQPVRTWSTKFYSHYKCDAKLLRYHYYQRVVVLRHKPTADNKTGQFFKAYLAAMTKNGYKIRGELDR